MAKDDGGLWLGVALTAALYGTMVATAERNRPLPAEPQGTPRAFSRKSIAERAAARQVRVVRPHRRRTPGPGQHGPVFHRAPTETEDRAIERGRGARYPWQIPRLGWWFILRRTAIGIFEDHLGLIAAGVAFYMLLAIFPALVLAVAVVGLFTEPSYFIGQLNEISEVLPRDVASLLVTQATDIASRPTGGLGLAALIGLVVALYSSSRGIMSLIEGLNVAYDEDEKRGLIRLNVESLVLTVVLIAGGLCGIMATVVIPLILTHLGIREGWLAWFGTLRWPILICGTMVGLWILYRYGPSRRKARWQWLLVGAVLACLFMLAGTMGFAWYAAHLARYNQTFGALGGVVVMLMWLWLSAYITLIGAELNAEIEAQTGVDTTVGRPRPPGRRGAAKADTLGEPVS